MQKPFLLSCFRWLVLASLLLGAAAPGAVMAAPEPAQLTPPAVTLAPVPPAPAAPAAPQAAEPQAPPLVPSTSARRFSPDACFVPAYVPLGQDLEPMVVGPSDEVAKLEQRSRWNTAVSTSFTYSDTETTLATITPSAGSVAGAVLGMDKVVAVWRQGSTGRLMVRFWHEFRGWTDKDYAQEGYFQAALEPLPVGSMSGNPVVVAPNAVNFYIFQRSDSGALFFTKFNGSGFSEWAEVVRPILSSGLAIEIKSDPVVIAPEPDRILVFFTVLNRDKGGFELYLKQSVNDEWLSEAKSLGALPGEPNSMAAVAMGTSRAAVFVRTWEFGGSPTLSIKTWSIDDHQSDWSDTPAFSQLKTDFGAYAVASRGSNHMALAYQSFVDKVIYVQEWGPSAGWGAPVAVGAAQAYGAGSLSLVNTFSDEWLLVANMDTSDYKEDAVWYTTRKDAAWDPTWRQVASSTPTRSGSTILALPRTAHTAVVLGVSYSLFSGRPLLFHFSPAGALIGPPPGPPTRNLSTQANPYGQRMVKVNGRPYWLNLFRSAGVWKVEVRDLNTWKGSVFALNHADSGSDDSSMFSLAVADMDLVDGTANTADEVVVATLSGDKTKVDLSWLKLTPTGDPETVVSAAVTKMTTQTGSWAPPVRVAIGDLDGGTVGVSATSALPDGKRNEVFVSYAKAGQLAWRVQYYQFLNGALARKPLVSGSQYYADLSPKADTTKFTTLESTVAHLNPTGAGDTLLFLVGRGDTTKAELDLYKLKISGGVRYFASQPVKIPTTTLAMGSRPALAAGDLDADTVDEIVLTGKSALYVLDVAYEVPATIEEGLSTTTGVAGNMRLSLGDIDQDGRQEIWMGNGFNMYTALKLDPQGLYQVGHFNMPNPFVMGAPLVADIDNDSQLATFDYCQDYTSDITVHHVLYTPPVFYTTDKAKALQTYTGEFAKSHGTGNQEELGYHVNMGGSFGIGSKYEYNAPILGFHIGSYSFMATVDAMATIGRSTEVSKEVDFGRGYEGKGGPGNNDVVTRGRVMYSARNYSCFYYTLHDPQDATVTYPVQMCTAPSSLEAASCTIENWYQNTALTGGDGWLPLDSNGEPSAGLPPLNDVLDDKYDVTNAPPINEDQLIAVSPESIKIGNDINDGATEDNWYFAFENGKTSVKSGSTDVNFTLSGEVEIGGAVVASSVTAGAGMDWSSSQSWTDSVTYGGSWSLVPTPDKCSYCTPYRLVPYVYNATGVTNGGKMYRYSVQDYYITQRPSPREDPSYSQARAAAPASLAAPLAPEVHSLTHPDANLWYGNTAAFTWSPPAGDPALIEGYRWFYTQEAEDNPQYVATASANDHTYTGLPDGQYYFHILAVGSDGSLSPVTHYPFKVDGTAPTPLMSFNPVVPDGLNDWYTHPVTVTLEASDESSGLAGIEYSYDGATWNPYLAPLIFGLDTPGALLQVRAKDNAGNVSEPVSATIKIDMAVPSLRDTDNQRLSYANIQIQPNGNAQLVLGGVINDALSGRNMVLLKGGDDGLWTPVDELGDFAMPADNLLTSTQPFLNWFYRPSFDARGVYPLYAYGLDIAGNAGKEFLIGTFWWEPDAAPDLSESMASASPAAAHPGETVEFTVAARNTGYQEAMVIVTDTLPAGVTALPETIMEGGVYNPDTNQVVWRLRALWPGQTRYLTFQAALAANLPAGALNNRLDLEGYWEWGSDPSLPVEPKHHYFSTHNTLAVQAAGTAAGGPRIYTAGLQPGALLVSPQATLQLDASLDATALYIKEWTWDSASSDWKLAQLSDWVPISEATMTVDKDGYAQYLRYPYTLAAQPGAHYLSLWVANADGQVSSLNDDDLIYANLLLPASTPLPAGEKVQYRLPLQAGELALFNLVVPSGDADLFVWGPRHGFHPDYYTNGSSQVETLAFYAPETGVYVVEVQAASDAEYLLVATLGAQVFGLGETAKSYLDPSAATLEEAAGRLVESAAGSLPQGAHTLLEDKALPANPASLSTPLHLDHAFSVLAKFFLPLISKP